MMLVASSTSPVPSPKRSMTSSIVSTGSLPWTTETSEFGDEGLQAPGHGLDVLDAGADDEALALSALLAQERVAHQIVVEGLEDGTDRSPQHRGRRDDADVVKTDEARLEGTGDRVRGHGEDVAGRREFAQLRLVLGAEPLLSSITTRASSLKRCPRRKAHGADDATGSRRSSGPATIRFASSAGVRRERWATATPMARKRRSAVRVCAGPAPGGGDDGDLLSRRDGGGRGAQADLRLAVADVAADEAIHRSARGEVGEHGIDGRGLVRPRAHRGNRRRTARSSGARASAARALARRRTLIRSTMPRAVSWTRWRRSFRRLTQPSPFRRSSLRSPGSAP